MPHTSTQPQLSAELTENSRRAAFHWKRLFGEINPYDSIVWEKRTDKIERGDGTVVFEQKDVEVPSFWTQTATDIVASKYFRGRLGTPERETSARQMVDRVVDEIGRWGWEDGYFASETDAENFKQDLKWILINQYAAFNSPVWFNVGTTEHPQCSACFILSVEDTMESILKWCVDEGTIFRRGSGSGANLSKLRASMEHLSRGGTSSGPVSFMKASDGIANSIKSGGSTRRAAKMGGLNVDHPDIMDFIQCKVEEEKKERELMAAGYDMSNLNNDAWGSIQFQNANNTVRITDDFMHAVEANGAWETKYRISDEPAGRYEARQALLNIAKAAWECGDPGVQFDTIINDWHTCPASGRINASNPCSEYMHLDNSA